MSPRNRLLFGFATLALSVAVPAIAQQSLVLATLWEVNVSGGDYMTTNSSVERSAFPGRGAFIYIAKNSTPSTTPFYRLYNGVDHMDSYIAGEGGYGTEGALGYIWTSASALRGLGKPSRVYPTRGDHAEVRLGDTIAGYANVDAPNLYGYLRYNNIAEDFSTTTAGGLTVKSNKVAGGAVWSWVWNGTEFVDHADYGREIQAAIAWRDGGVVRNPTEAGSEISASLTAGENQGSPLFESNASGAMQTTRAIPLEWTPSLWGGDATHPVIYPAMLIGKDLTLNYNAMGPVARYVTSFTLASAVSNATVETPTGYMPASFNRFYTYDAASQTLTEVYPANTCIAGFLAFRPFSGHGGVIISSLGQDRAMAVAAKTAAAGGAIGQFNLIDCRAAANIVKWSVFSEGRSLPAGVTNYTSFISTGTLSTVVANMRTLYVNGDI